MPLYADEACRINISSLNTQHAIETVIGISDTGLRRRKMCYFLSINEEGNIPYIQVSIKYGSQSHWNILYILCGTVFFCGVCLVCSFGRSALWLVLRNGK